MADVKISGLPASTTPLAGTEVLPIVQGGATKQVSIANVTAGRAVSGASFIPSSATIPTNGVYLPAADTVGFATNSTYRGSFDSSGNLLVGSTALATGFSGLAQAQVSGNQGGLIINSGTGNIGRLMFLQNNASGNEGLIRYNFFDKTMQFWVDVAERMRIFATGGVSIGDTTDPGAGNLRLATGNLVIGTSGKGIDFSATAGTGTSELLADYEEGTWTPTGNNITLAAGTTGKYTKVGNLVTVTFTINFPTTADTSTANVGGFPFAAGQYSNLSLQGPSFGTNALLNSGANFATFVNTTNTAYLTNANLSAQAFYGFASYQV